MGASQLSEIEFSKQFPIELMLTATTPLLPVIHGAAMVITEIRETEAEDSLLRFLGIKIETLETRITHYQRLIIERDK